MFNISTKFSQNADFRAILVNKNSNLLPLKSLLDLNSLNSLRDKAAKNKRGYTFVSSIQNSKFRNFYFFNVFISFIIHNGYPKFALDTFIIF